MFALTFLELTIDKLGYCDGYIEIYGIAGLLTLYVFRNCTVSFVISYATGVIIEVRAQFLSCLLIEYNFSFLDISDKIVFEIGTSY